jgi:hypothetical protein
LQTIEISLRHPIQQGVAVVKSATHDRASQSIGHILVDELTNMAQTTYMVVARLNYTSHMIVESQMLINSDAEDSNSIRAADTSASKLKSI